MPPTLTPAPTLTLRILRLKTLPRLPSPTRASIRPSSSQPTPTHPPPPIRPYRLLLTPTHGIPVYQLSKRGGNQHQTKVRRIEGDVQALRTDLQLALGLGRREVVVNALTGCVLIKGHKRQEVVKFIEEHGLARHA